MTRLTANDIHTSHEKTFRAFTPKGPRITVCDATQQGAIERVKRVCREYRWPIKRTVETMRRVRMRPQS